MVSVSIQPSRGVDHETDGDIVLTDGRTILLSSISGKNWNTQRIQRLTNAVQRQMDLGPRGTGIRQISSLQDNDPDKAPALAGDNEWFSNIYGGRMFIEGTTLVSRSTLITFTMVDGKLMPELKVVW